MPSAKSVGKIRHFKAVRFYSLRNRLLFKPTHLLFTHRKIFKSTYLITDLMTEKPDSKIVSEISGILRKKNNFLRRKSVLR